MNHLIDFSRVSPQQLLEKLQISQPPIDPFAIAQQLGIPIDEQRDYSRLNDSGAISVHQGQVRIWVNPLEVQHRRRFTAAHELGHLVYDILPRLETEAEQAGFTDSYARSDRRDPCERRANEFAAKLLMPGQMVLDQASDYLNDCQQQGLQISLSDLTLALAKIFQVSSQAMAIRLRDLGIG